MSSLKYRVALILALFLASVWALYPRTVMERVRQPDGSFAYRPVQRVPLKRGLDLQGGMHLALEVDESKGVVTNKSEALENALRVVRNRIDQFGVSEPVVQKVGEDRIIVELPGIDDPERATAVVQKSAFLEFQITDKSQALDRAAPRIDALTRSRGLATATAAAPGAAKQASAGEKAVQSLFAGSSDSAAKVASADTAKRAAGADTAASDSGSAALTGSREGPFSKLIQPSQMPGQYLVATADELTVNRILSDSVVAAALPPGKVIRWGADTATVGGRAYRELYVLDSRPIITGDAIEKAQPRSDPVEGTVVAFELNNEGARRFKNETAKHIQDYMAIVLDERVMSAPIIQSSIGRNGQITMGRGADLQEAQDLALVLRAGSLPVPLKVAEVRTIGASLGQDSVDDGIKAGLIAIALVIVIMIGYYRFSGVLAVAALALYMLYTLAVLAGFDAVLTLPGIAGLVLSVGVAVDANVLIFERIREELGRGKTVRTAIDEGFRHALSAIVDTSVTTILTAAILYQYGTGPVRGFAVTLIAGITASLFTAIFVVRTFYLIWLSRVPAGKALSI